MKKRIVLLSFMVIFGGLINRGMSWSLKSDQPWTPKEEEKYQEKLERQSKKRLRIVSVELRLTEDQRQQIETILKDRNEKVVMIEKEYRQKKADLRDETKGKVMALLTPEQKDLYENGQGELKGSHIHDQSPGRYKGGGLHED